MDAFTIATLMVVVLLLLIFLRMPIALGMGVIGAVGYILLSSTQGLLAYLNGAWVDKFMSYEFAIVPLFILMGHIATRSGISASLFSASNAWIGHLRGGLAMASVAGCAMFGAISGSSLATASTMARVALPEMRKAGYSGALSAGSLAAGGTLGILIPPSIVLIIYALLTEQNIVKLFLAATIPGLLAVAGFFIAIAIYVRVFPNEAPRQAKAPLSVRLKSLGQIWHIVLIFVVVLGGIYGGFFTPAEGASVGVVMTLLVGFGTRKLGLRGLVDCLIDTAASSAMIFAIVFGADIFNVALALSRMPIEVADFFSSVDIAPMWIMLAMVAFYLVMGCVMDSLSMILLTVPVFFPTIMALDFGLMPEQQAMWFGIITLVVVEMGLITPPVGMNLFVISSMAKDIPTSQIFRGATPFIIAEFCRIALLVSFPVLSFWLVDLVAN
ncbi:TRAP transporter large permease [Pacificibacter marinus]|uniref:TRAP transporter large permease protein n=1 Tax=Pacificibacter marinus TaxID=658057 RepID=A0A1Y5RHM8_9RHOB|nr:TRAP transporter large permease [Pacificibacter marinus]SEK18761.1 TRAP transporter, DctM subunit [Pacificibacter marinus]SLN17639.1 Sialic acid TRAP transporter permease protein SiaT [Pacificibacter marinus]